VGVFAILKGMNWARKRQIFVAAILAAIGISLTTILFVVFSTNPATCFDGEQNGTETGLDCGGGCELVCSADVRPLSVSFAQYVVTDGRPDVIAHITNPNKTADAVVVEYSVEVFTAEGDIFAQHKGSLDVPHESRRAVFIPRIASIAPDVARAFLTITKQTFYSSEEGPVLRAKSFAWKNLDTNPVLTAIIQGDLEERVRRAPLVVTVFDSENTVLAVSQTIIDDIKIDEEKEVIFTWNTPFKVTPTRVEFLFDTPRSYGGI
jgi:hypothetical protein